VSANPPVALTIAGSDSGGGAGIQADLRTFAALGVFGTTAITAVTAQNSLGVNAVHELPAEMVVAQVEAVLEDFPVAAVKTGMLATGSIVEAVAQMADAGWLPNLVVDPVMVASSGASLANAAAIDAVRSRLLPHATVITPNLPEAGALAAAPARTLEDQRDLARRLATWTDATVVVKGGHADDELCTDVVWDGSVLHQFDRPRLVTDNVHGSGCSFAAAIAAYLASGAGVLEAIEAAGDFVHEAIAGAQAWSLTAGPGPLDHFGWGRER
jgi:hydroxymethylpyrimidine/phosphomethylpyrimidine kinase